LLLRVTWLVTMADRKIADDEALLMRHLVGARCRGPGEAEVGSAKATSTMTVVRAAEIVRRLAPPRLRIVALTAAV
jgi:hypothetical protein